MNEKNKPFRVPLDEMRLLIENYKALVKKNPMYLKKFKHLVEPQEPYLDDALYRKVGDEYTEVDKYEFRDM